MVGSSARNRIIAITLYIIINNFKNIFICCIILKLDYTQRIPLYRFYEVLCYIIKRWVWGRPKAIENTSINKKNIRKTFLVISSVLNRWSILSSFYPNIRKVDSNNPHAMSNASVAVEIFVSSFPHHSVFVGATAAAGTFCPLQTVRLAWFSWTRWSFWQIFAIAEARIQSDQSLFWVGEPYRPSAEGDECGKASNSHERQRKTWHRCQCFI